MNQIMLLYALDAINTGANSTTNNKQEQAQLEFNDIHIKLILKNMNDG